MLSGFLPLGSSLSTQDTLSIADISSLDQEASVVFEAVFTLHHVETAFEYVHL